MKIKFTYASTPFIISVDSNQYILSKKSLNTQEKSKNFGKETEIDLGFFVRIEDALEKAIKVSLTNIEEETTLRGFIEAIKGYKNEVKQNIEAVK